MAQAVAHQPVKDPAAAAALHNGSTTKADSALGAVLRRSAKAEANAGKILKSIRTSAGLSQGAFASIIGSNQSTVSALERGVFKPSEGYMLAVAAFLTNLARPNNESVPVTELGRIVRAHRKRVGYSQARLNQAIGRYAAVEKIENGSRTSASYETLVKLADAFLLEGEERAGFLKYSHSIIPASPQLGSKLRNFRERVHMSQQELAYCAGFLDKSSISFIESGRSGIDIKRMDSIARNLGITTEELHEMVSEEYTSLMEYIPAIAQRSQRQKAQGSLAKRAVNPERQKQPRTYSNRKRSIPASPQRGRSIRRFRERAGMSQQELANAAGLLDKSSISRIENGEKGIRIKCMDAFARNLSLSREELHGIVPEEYISAMEYVPALVTRRSESEVLRSSVISSVRS